LGLGPVKDILIIVFLRHGEKVSSL
jgi:hypothetical protein